MPAHTHHADYAAAAIKWQRCADAVTGQQAVHDRGETYLPRLKDQTDADYNAMKLRANYFNASGRTLSGLVGMVFRKPPAITIPDAMQSIIDDMDLQGTSLDNLAQDTLSDTLQLGRVGYLVEYPQVSQQPVSQAAAARLNLRPYVSKYPAASIINWKTKRVNNVMQPVLIVLQESYDVPLDEFESKREPQIRALMLTELGYVQQLYRKDKRGEYVPYDAPIVPLLNGKPLDAIPFYAFGPCANELTIQNPPLLDLVELNLAHYRVNADYQHGSHFAGLPTAVVSGYQANEGEKLYIGSATAWVFPDPQARASYLEFTGQGLGAIEKNLDRLEAQMAAIGARMLAPEKSGVEAQATVALRHNGESSVLAALAQMVSSGLTEMLQFIALWSGNNPDAVDVQLNTDFMPQQLTAQELTALVSTWQMGAISSETLHQNLVDGEIISAAVDFETEQARIANQPLRV